jgi:CheY-like chemotaxis protein/HPt (histidine-containing phosphotransfer) domain-containing protein
VTRDRAEIRSWYQQAMLRRVDELRGLRESLEAGDGAACDAAREIGQALRGSGATFGFPDLTSVATIVETSADADVLRRVEGLISELRVLTAPDGVPGTFSAEWLARAADLPDSVAALDGARDVADAWDAVSRASGMDGSALAERVAERLGLEIADLGSRGRSALRLVPEALLAAGRVVPLREDSVTITVATAEPTCLPMELELERLTGRRPVFVVAPPEALDAVLAEILDAPMRPEGRPSRGPVRPTLDQADLRNQGILVVDDEPSARLLVRTLLEKRGYHVVEAGDGLEALEIMAADEPIGLVIVDLNMPRMDGLELMWELRDAHDRKRLPIIVVTGEVDEILETQLMEEGADDYIRKPVDPRLFLARVEATFRRAEH